MCRFWELGLLLGAWLSHRNSFKVFTAFFIFHQIYVWAGLFFCGFFLFPTFSFEFGILSGQLMIECQDLNLASYQDFVNIWPIIRNCAKSLSIVCPLKIQTLCLIDFHNVHILKLPLSIHLICKTASTFEVNYLPIGAHKVSASSGQSWITSIVTLPY